MGPTVYKLRGLNEVVLRHAVNVSRLQRFRRGGWSTRETGVAHEGNESSDSEIRQSSEGKDEPWVVVPNASNGESGGDQ